MHVSQSQTAGFVLGTVIVSFVVNVLSGTWAQYRWLWASLGVLLLILVFLVPHDGLLRRSRRGSERWVRIVATLLLVAYPVVLLTTSAVTSAFLSSMVSGLLLFAATAILAVIALGLKFENATIAITLMVCALGGLLRAPTFWYGGSYFVAAAFALLALADTVMGVSLLRAGRSALRSSFGLTAGLLGTAGCVGGVGVVLGEAGFFGVASSSLGTAEIGIGLGGIVVGLGVFVRKPVLVFTGLLFVPASILLAGIDLIRLSQTLVGVAIVLAACAMAGSVCLLAAGRLRLSAAMWALAMLGCLVFEAAFFLGDNNRPFGGWAGLIVVCALFVAALVPLLAPETVLRELTRLRRWLTQTEVHAATANAVPGPDKEERA